MNDSLRSLKLLFLKGLYFIIPFMIIIIVIKTSIEILKNITEPFVKLLPEESLFGLGMSYTVSVIFLLMLILIAGILQNKENGINLISKFENFLPGYSVIKKIFSIDAESGLKSKIKSCLVSVDDAWLFAFIIEESKDGIITVFVPSSPTPTSGNVYFMNENKIRRIDVLPKEIFKCLTQLGSGSEKILKGKVNWQSNLGNKI